MPAGPRDEYECATILVVEDHKAPYLEYSDRYRFNRKILADLTGIQTDKVHWGTMYHRGGYVYKYFFQTTGAENSIARDLMTGIVPANHAKGPMILSLYGFVEDEDILETDTIEACEKLDVHSVVPLELLLEKWREEKAKPKGTVGTCGCTV